MADVKISEMSSAGTLDGTELVEVVKGSVNKKTTTQDIADLAAGDGKKEYVAYLSQSGSSAPTATVINNTLGGTVVWARSGSGSFTGTLMSAFPSGKVFITNGYSLQSYSGTDFIEIIVSRGNDNIINVLTSLGANGTAASTDGLITNYMIKIEVYP